MELERAGGEGPGDGLAAGPPSGQGAPEGTGETVRPEAGASAGEPAAGGEGVADGALHALDPASVEVDTIVGWIVAGVMSCGILVCLAIVWLLVPWPWPLKAAATGAGVALSLGLTAFCVLWPPIKHRHVRYRLDEVGLEIRQGVVWHSVITVPRSRVQHTDVNQGPIQRRFGLATLVVHTAGTESASVELSGLARRTAFAIRDELIAATAEPET